MRRKAKPACNGYVSVDSMATAESTHINLVERPIVYVRAFCRKVLSSAVGFLVVSDEVLKSESREWVLLSVTKARQLAFAHAMTPWDWIPITVCADATPERYGFFRKEDEVSRVLLRGYRCSLHRHRIPRRCDRLPEHAQCSSSDPEPR